MVKEFVVVLLLTRLFQVIGCGSGDTANDGQGNATVAVVEYDAMPNEADANYYFNFSGGNPYLSGVNAIYSRADHNTGVSISGCNLSQSLEAPPSIGIPALFTSAQNQQSITEMLRYAGVHRAPNHTTYVPGEGSAPSSPHYKYHMLSVDNNKNYLTDGLPAVAYGNSHTSAGTRALFLFTKDIYGFVGSNNTSMQRALIYISAHELGHLLAALTDYGENSSYYETPDCVMNGRDASYFSSDHPDFFCGPNSNQTTCNQFFLTTNIESPSSSASCQ
jgi:hypothetical protein